MLNMLTGRISAYFLTPFLLFLSLCIAPFSLQATAILPSPQNIKVEKTFDRMGPIANIYLWRTTAAGSDETACSDEVSCSNNLRANTLVCLSSEQTAHGACPTMPIWLAGGIDPHVLRLDFTHAEGERKTLTLRATRWISDNGSSWDASSFAPDNHPVFFNVSIPAAELAQLSKPGTWSARLSMQVVEWQMCPEARTSGCPGRPLVDWNAEILLSVTDISTQQIYFPAFSQANPRIDLRLNNHPGRPDSNLTASGNNTLDMCLYDGSNSSSKRISLVFEDEKSDAPGRAPGQFSVYRDGEDKSQAKNRIDYQISVIDPTTGASQSVSNGSEIIWTDTNSRNILRPVVLPGVPGTALCVPAPITLTTPQFTLAEKTSGGYTGMLRIIYTPQT